MKGLQTLKKQRSFLNVFTRNVLSLALQITQKIFSELPEKNNSDTVKPLYNELG